MRTDTLERLQYVCGLLVGVAEAVREDGETILPTRDHIAIIKHFNQLRLANDQIKEAREALVEMANRLSYEEVPEVMAEHNIRTITVEGVGRVSITHRWSCSMLDKELGMNWLRNTGNEGIIQETVNSSTLAAFAKSKMEEDGESLPADIFKTGITAYTSITKAGVIKDYNNGN